MRRFADAEVALRRAADVEKAARERSGWHARYLWAFAAGQLVLVPVAVLWHGFASAVAFGLGNTFFVTGLSLYAARQRVVRRGFGVKHGLVVGTWAVVFVLSVTLGSSAFGSSPAFAVVAALMCALPLATGAWLEMRRSS
ncbi:hypothetical protein GO001_25505 [Streptomyces sp. NRRL B-1677]|uniref:Uncharacterized protein n=1 Tax=Streptomyces klenkii TaxID=1420899 RepID=A0A3B0BX58_9ACTN|nr:MULTISPECIES: hypothetical protein [Streptomyces]MBF6048523.1 hypothetical protein [Streptomyces sp. NRRL B-1677]RKN77592.1 hypothetical protein D7231_02485 [Streptomyces klenkii]